MISKKLYKEDQLEVIKQVKEMTIMMFEY